MLNSSYQKDTGGGRGGENVLPGPLEPPRAGLDCRGPHDNYISPLPPAPAPHGSSTKTATQSIGSAAKVGCRKILLANRTGRGPEGLCSSDASPAPASSFKDSKYRPLTD
ncbi:hypothetical protein KIL84_015098 [Mauremys mutica]|uniref:Uncharacterized protein n=1 Tax=Mauremys mutica TaxID=74926 RepID=A0A9D4B1D0_9SAUR|nr:hypothetical protein KIL84_015098 [Mauremys mutica]